MSPTSSRGRYRRPRLAAQLRGRVTPRILDHWNRTGWHVHRVGQAAYVHSPGGELHLLFGVWDRRGPIPPWAARLGRPSAGYERRAERCARNQHGRLFLRDGRGRFLVRLPWWRVPGPRLYRWLAPAPSLFELERGYR